MRIAHDWLPVDVPDNVHLDDRVYLYSSYAFNHCRSEMAEAVHIGADTALYDATSFELGPRGSVSIGRYGVINGPLFIANSRITVGDYAYMSYEVFITDAQIPIPPVDPEYEPVKWESDEPSIVIGDDCWIGLRSVVLGGTRLGRGVIVGAGSVVQGDFPDFTVVAGNPARVRAKLTES